MNVKVGDDNTVCERVIGKHGCGTRNDNGERLVAFCLSNNCTIGGTFVPSSHTRTSISLLGNHQMEELQTK